MAQKLLSSVFEFFFVCLLLFFFVLCIAFLRVMYRFNQYTLFCDVSESHVLSALVEISKLKSLLFVVSFDFSRQI